MYMIINKLEDKPVAFLNTQEQVDKYMERFDNTDDYDIISYKGIEDCEQKEIGQVIGSYGMLTFIGGTDSWNVEKYKKNKYIDMDSKSMCVNFNTVYGLSKAPSNNTKGITIYKAYIADKDTEIPDIYTCVGKFTEWLNIIGNTGTIVGFKAKRIEVYRMGGFECVVKLIN